MTLLAFSCACQTKHVLTGHLHDPIQSTAQHSKQQINSISQIKCTTYSSKNAKVSQFGSKLCVGKIGMNRGKATRQAKLLNELRAYQARCINDWKVALKTKANRSKWAGMVHNLANNKAGHCARVGFDVCLCGALRDNSNLV
jgi:hypothetical protein